MLIVMATPITMEITRRSNDYVDSVVGANVKKHRTGFFHGRRYVTMQADEDRGEPEFSKSTAWRLVNKPGRSCLRLVAHNPR